MNVLAILCALLAIYHGYRAIRELRTASKLDNSGATVQGTVLDLATKNDEESGSIAVSHSVTYRFSTERQAYIGSQGISRQTCENLIIGAPVMVRYLTTDPNISRLTGLNADHS